MTWQCYAVNLTAAQAAHVARRLYVDFASTIDRRAILHAIADAERANDYPLGLVLNPPLARLIDRLKKELKG